MSYCVVYVCDSKRKAYDRSSIHSRPASWLCALPWILILILIPGLDGLYGVTLYTAKFDSYNTEGTVGLFL